MPGGVGLDLKRRILLRLKVFFVNGARFIVSKILTSCSRESVVIEQGDRKVVIVNHFYYDAEREHFCLGSFKIDPNTNVSSYKRCVDYGE